jgi:hypothetical protein
MERKNIKVKVANTVDINLETWRVWGCGETAGRNFTRGQNISVFWGVVRLLLMPRKREAST